MFVVKKKKEHAENKVAGLSPRDKNVLILLFICPLRVLYTHMRPNIKNFKNPLFLIEMFYPAVPMSLFEAQSLRAIYSSIK